MKTKATIKRKGSCKKVVNATQGKTYSSVTEAAFDIGVHISAVSYAVRHETPCKGNMLYFENKAYKYVPKIMHSLADANAENATLKAKAEAWDRYVAEKEAEERRLVREAEAHEKAIAKAEAKVAKLEAKYERKTLALNKVKSEAREAFVELEKAIAELNELNADMTINWEVK